MLVLPIGLYLLLIKIRAQGAVLYSAPLLWPVAAASLAAALFSYAVLRRKVPCEEELPADFRDFASDFDGTVQELSTQSPAPAFSGEAEYPELFSDDRDKAADETGTQAENDMSAKIAFAIWAQKERCDSAPVPDDVTSDEDDMWKSYLKSGKAEDNKPDMRLYDDLPSELPEGYIQKETDAQEDREFSKGYTVKRITLGETLISKAVCVSAAAVLSLGLAFGASFSLTAHTDSGFTCGTAPYAWADVEKLTVSQRLFGSLSVSAKTADGRKTELFPSTVFKGEGFYEKYESIYACMANTVHRAQASGAEIIVLDREAIDTYYKDADDATYDYISQIINEGETENDR